MYVFTFEFYAKRKRKRKGKEAQPLRTQTPEPGRSGSNLRSALTSSILGKLTTWMCLGFPICHMGILLCFPSVQMLLWDLPR